MNRLRLWLWTLRYRLKSLPIDSGDIIGAITAVMVFEGVRGLLSFHWALLVLAAPLWAIYLWRELRPAPSARRRP